MRGRVDGPVSLDNPKSCAVASFSRHAPANTIRILSELVPDAACSAAITLQTQTVKPNVKQHTEIVDNHAGSTGEIRQFTAIVSFISPIVAVGRTLSVNGGPSSCLNEMNTI
jgi:hypothetical protein